METDLSVGWSTDITVDLVNTVTSDRDVLCTPSELSAFLLAHGESAPIDVDAADVAAIRELRSRLRTVFETADEVEAAAVVNDLLGAHATRPYLSDHDGTAWHLHVARPQAGWPEWLAARTALALALVIADDGFPRLRRCEAPGCAVVLLDTSRNHTRRFCSTTCATRTRVAAHRRRHNSEPGIAS